MQFWQALQRFSAMVYPLNNGNEFNKFINHKTEHTMTLVRFKNVGHQKPFNNFADHFFNEMPSLFRDDSRTAGTTQTVPVNVKETENGYLLEVVAPGWNKEDFNIGLEDNTLTISGERKEEKGKDEKQIRTEYRFQSFKRSFTLDENIDTENIGAQYVNGVLTLNLPRKAEVKQATKQISVQ